VRLRSTTGCSPTLSSAARPPTSRRTGTSSQWAEYTGGSDEPSAWSRHAAITPTWQPPQSDSYVPCLTLKTVTSQTSRGSDHGASSGGQMRSIPLEQLTRYERDSVEDDDAI